MNLDSRVRSYVRDNEGKGLQGSEEANENEDEEQQGSSLPSHKVPSLESCLFLDLGLCLCER